LSPLFQSNESYRRAFGFSAFCETQSPRRHRASPLLVVPS
jgi:hypothetical protein